MTNEQQKEFNHALWLHLRSTLEATNILNREGLALFREADKLREQVKLDEEKKSLEKAVAKFRMGIELYPTDLDEQYVDKYIGLNLGYLYKNLGDCYTRLKQPSKAREALRKGMDFFALGRLPYEARSVAIELGLDDYVAGYTKKIENLDYAVFSFAAHLGLQHKRYELEQKKREEGEE